MIAMISNTTVAPAGPLPASGTHDGAATDTAADFGAFLGSTDPGPATGAVTPPDATAPQVPARAKATRAADSTPAWPMIPDMPEVAVAVTGDTPDDPLAGLPLPAREAQDGAEPEAPDLAVPVAADFLLAQFGSQIPGIVPQMTDVLLAQSGSQIPGIVPQVDPALAASPAEASLTGPDSGKPAAAAQPLPALPFPPAAPLLQDRSEVVPASAVRQADGGHPADAGTTDQMATPVDAESSAPVFVPQTGTPALPVTTDASSGPGLAGRAGANAWVQPALSPSAASPDLSGASADPAPMAGQGTPDAAPPKPAPQLPYDRQSDSASAAPAPPSRGTSGRNPSPVPTVDGTRPDAKPAQARFSLADTAGLQARLRSLDGNQRSAQGRQVPVPTPVTSMPVTASNLLSVPAGAAMSAGPAEPGRPAPATARPPGYAAAFAPPRTTDQTPVAGRPALSASGVPNLPGESLLQGGHHRHDPAGIPADTDFRRLSSYPNPPRTASKAQVTRSGPSERGLSLNSGQAESRRDAALAAILPAAASTGAKLPAHGATVPPIPAQGHVVASPDPMPDLPPFGAGPAATAEAGQTSARAAPHGSGALPSGPRRPPQAVTLPAAPQTPVSADAARLNAPARHAALSDPAANPTGQPPVWNAAASFWPQVLGSQPDPRRGAASSTLKPGSGPGRLDRAAAPEAAAATHKPDSQPLPGPHLPFATRPRPGRDAEPAPGAPAPTPPQPKQSAPRVAPTPRHLADERHGDPPSTQAPPAPVPPPPEPLPPGPTAPMVAPTPRPFADERHRAPLAMLAQPAPVPPPPAPTQPEPSAPMVATIPRHFADEQQLAPLSTLAQPVPVPPPSAPTVALTSRPIADEQDPAPLSALSQPASAAAGSLHAPHGLPRSLPQTLARSARDLTGDEPTELLLDPAELGKVRFELTTTGDRVQVNLSVERADTLDLLRRNIDVLRAEFRDAGFDAATLTFGQWGQGHEDAPPSDPSQIPEDALVTPDHAAPPSHGHNPSDQGLHLRL